MYRHPYIFSLLRVALPRSNLNTKVSPQSKMATPMASVPLERLRALEALEASLPEVIAKAKAEAVEVDKRERLERLTAPRKADPKTYSAEVLKKYHENKEEINARRREAYKAKKEAAAKATGPPA